MRTKCKNIEFCNDSPSLKRCRQWQNRMEMALEDMKDLKTLKDEIHEKKEELKILKKKIEKKKKK